MSTNFENLFDPSTFQDALKFFFTPPYDVKTFVETQEKNVQACNESHQKWMETVQNTGKLQMQILGDMIETSSALLKAAAAEGTPEDKFAQQTEISRKGYEKSMKNLKALADLSGASSKEFSDLFQKRVNAVLHETHASLNKTARKQV